METAWYSLGRSLQDQLASIILLHGPNVAHYPELGIQPLSASAGLEETLSTYGVAPAHLLFRVRQLPRPTSTGVATYAAFVLREPFLQILGLTDVQLSGESAAEDIDSKHQSTSSSAGRTRTKIASFVFSFRVRIQGSSLILFTHPGLSVHSSK